MTKIITAYFKGYTIDEKGEAITRLLEEAGGKFFGRGCLIDGSRADISFYFPEVEVPAVIQKLQAIEGVTTDVSNYD